MITLLRNNTPPLTFPAAPDRSLMDLLQEQQVFLDAPCGGNRKCGKCKIYASGALSPVTAEEKSLLSVEELAAGVRLACCTFALGDAQVRLMGENRAAFQVQTQSAAAEVGALCPSVRVRSISVRPGTLEDQSPDAARVLDALTEAGETHLDVTPTARRAAPALLRAHEGKAAAVIWDPGFGRAALLDLLPPHGQSLFGMGVDIGTTTVVAYYYDLTTGALVDTQSALNPQRAFGADVISRIAAAGEKDGLALQAEAIRSQLSAFTAAFAEKTGADPARIYHVTIAANTTMLHLLCGMDPAGIAAAPFLSADLFGWEMEAARLGLSGLCPEARVSLLPCISSYVGADIVAGMVSCDLDRTGDHTVFLDVGTNGEMSYRSGDTLLCCSTAAGPAFEGAHIRCGTGGVPGAVSKVWLEGEEIRYETIGGLPAIGICGSGLIDAVAVMLKAGIVDETGRLLDEDELEEPWLDRLDEEGNFLLVPDRNILLTQQDLREVQLAKAAICAGIDTMLHVAGTDPDELEQLIIAGGFGAHIHPESAVTIGLLPEEAEGKIAAVGNAAGAGAAAALLSKEALCRIRTLPAHCRYLELSGDAFFQDAYVERMMFESAVC